MGIVLMFLASQAAVGQWVNQWNWHQKAMLETFDPDFCTTMTNDHKMSDWLNKFQQVCCDNISKRLFSANMKT